jgi:feruloyl esterase
MSFPASRHMAVVVLVASSVSQEAVAQAAPGEPACAALRQLQVPGAALSEVSAEWFAQGSPPPQEPPWVPPLAVPLPAYCRLSATLDRRTGADGRSYGIGFALALPAGWNGRFLFQGGGGLNGRVAPPLGRTGQGDAALTRGFAVVTTDTGHRGEVFDASFMADQQASLDFAYQAVGRVAVLAKQILTQHYGRPAARAYFMGCSTGGREGMLMAQRYPAYFDGIVVGAPAMRTHFSGIGDEWVATMLNNVAPLDVSGKPDGRRAFSQADRKAVVDGLLGACDATDGLRDGIVSDPIGCRFDPAALVCAAEKADGCLSGPQADALARAFAGPKDSKGRPVYPGFPFDTGIAATQGIPGLLAGSMNPVGAPFTATKMDVDTRAEDAAAQPHMQLTSTWSWTKPQHVLEPRRQAPLLPRRERPVVLGPRHGRLLRADDPGQRRRFRRHRLEPALPGAGDGPLWRRPRDARQLRHAERGRGLGREPEAPAGRPGHGPQLARAQPAAVPLPVARALQGLGRRRGRRVVRVPIA